MGWSCVCTMKKSTVCSEALQSAYEITKLTKHSPKRNVQFNKIASQHEDERGAGILKFCPTRWTVWGESINSFTKLQCFKGVMGKCSAVNFATG